MTTSRIWAVIPAAGAGSRMNADRPKQYLEILGKTILEHTIERLLTFPFENVVVVLSAEDQYQHNIAILENSRIQKVEGGSERYYSVLNGLKALADIAHDDDWVMVHDVARPCIHQNDLHTLTKALHNHSVGGLLGTPVVDTLKRVGADGQVKTTVDRTGLWRALTPQMFRIGVLRRAIEQAIERGIAITDEASAVEYAGLQPLMVEGRSDNIKVTLARDLPQTALFIKQQLQLNEVVS